MNQPDYTHIFFALGAFYVAIRNSCMYRLLGQPPHWPFIAGGYPMSTFSRWLVFAFSTLWGTWQLFRGLLHLPPSFWSVAVSLPCLFIIVRTYLKDRRRSQRGATVG
jgi:hypothetical protein